MRSDGSHFFSVRVVGEGAWLIDLVNAPGGGFLETLNAQASAFGARMVLSHAAVAGAAANGTDNPRARGG